MSTARKSDRYLGNNWLATRKERFQSGAAVMRMAALTKSHPSLRE